MEHRAELRVIAGEGSKPDETIYSGFYTFRDPLSASIFQDYAERQLNAYIADFSPHPSRKDLTDQKFVVFVRTNCLSPFYTVEATLSVKEEAKELEEKVQAWLSAEGFAVKEAERMEQLWSTVDRFILKAARKNELRLVDIEKLLWPKARRSGSGLSFWTRIKILFTGRL